MHSSEGPTSASLLFVFTTFPLLSETFLQREMRIIRASGLPFRIVSLWGGDREWEGLPVERHGLRGIAKGLLRLPMLLCRHPDVLHQWSRWAAYPRSSGWLNWVEALLGLSFALSCAGRFPREGVRHIHGVWGSAPAMAAMAIRQLDGIPFSFGAHAYDLFEMGGDGWLAEKVAAAEWVRTSTRMGLQRLRIAGAAHSQLYCCRRGLELLPAWRNEWQPHRPLRLLSVGRMVEKMGHARQIRVFQQLEAAGIPFEVTWIGDGPLRADLERLIQNAGLGQRVEFRGWQAYSLVEAAYAGHDVFLFTGRPDRRGDRAGLPNAVAEAMAWGLPVVSTVSGAVEEALQDGQTGLLWRSEPEAAVILRLIHEPGLAGRLRAAARNWVEEHYDARRNLATLVDLWRAGLDKGAC